MNGVLRRILKPLPNLVRWYLSRKRTYRFRGLTIDVLPGVFHPGFFFSTTMLLEFVEKQSLQHTAVLEVGAGSGIISLLAARMGATVTATDISGKAIENIRLNAGKNNAALSVIQSDLFDRLPPQKFDWIFVNPPYYPRQPVREEEFAWYCGEQHEYFEKFFRGLAAFRTSGTQVIMVLSEVCDLDTISKLAATGGFELERIAEKKVVVDGKNYLFRITPVGSIQRRASIRNADK